MSKVVEMLKNGRQVNMSAVGPKTLKTFKTVFFGDYAAKRLGNTVFVAGKDGSKQGYHRESITR